ncbi:MAG: DUF2029 domain-containing protein [Anaerolineaceae bacterium]|nr:DUF2029 domain-containing protein [Anaerolineaceae bacterium]
MKQQPVLNLWRPSLIIIGLPLYIVGASVLLILSAIGIFPLSIYRVVLLLLPILLLAYVDVPQLPNVRTLIMLPALVVIVVFGVNLVALMAENIQTIPEWDFHLFRSYGLALSNGMNPYIPDNLLVAGESLNLSAAIQRELLNYYPPPTMFLFLPLGWFDVHTAYLVWYGLQCTALLISVYMLWVMWLGGQDRLQLLALIGLMFAFGPVYSTLVVGQINFLLLMCLLLYWRDHQHIRGGVWLALAVLVKPIAAVMLVFVIIRLQWRLLLSCAATLLVMSLLAMAAFGADMVLQYVFDNPIANQMPLFHYNELVNQSLLATLLRITDYDINLYSPYSQPIFIVLAAVMTLIVVWLVYRLRDHDDWLFGVLIAFALLLYPKTLLHYSLLLIVPLCLLLASRARLPGGWLTVVGAFIIIYFFTWSSPYSFFIANLVMWLFVVGMGYWWLGRRSGANQLVLEKR